MDQRRLGLHQDTQCNLRHKARCTYGVLSGLGVETITATGLYGEL
jgi:hypothetical protein